MQELSHFNCQRYKNFLRQILVLFATRLVAQCWAQIPIQDNLQSIYRNLEQFRCQHDYALTTIDEFFLLDLLGSPGEVEQDELVQGLESNFLNTLITTITSATLCPLTNIHFNVSLITSTINQTSNKDGHVRGMDAVSSSHQVFSDILRLQTLLCQPSECDTPASIFKQNETLDSSSEQAGSQWLQDTSCPFSTCTFPTLSRFLQTWKRQSIFESFEINSLTPLFLQENCSDGSFTKFKSLLHITLAATNSSSLSPEWTNNMLDVFAELFTDSYNRVNGLSSTLCDPSRRQITKSRASVVDLSNTTVKLKLSIGGLCQYCQSIFNVFEVLDEEGIIVQDQGHRQRRLESSNYQGCLCPNSSETLLRGPTVDEFVAVFRTLVEQVPGTESELYVAEVMEIQVQAEVQAAQTRMTSPRCGDGQVTSYETNIAIDYSGVCQALADSDVAILEDAILNTYNAMVQSQYCDPVSRRITNVSYVSEAIGVNDGQLTVQFFVAGTCQGCNSTTSSVSIFDTEEVDSTTGDSQSVQTNVPVNVDDGTSCSCATDVVASRAPTQEEFLGAYDAALLTFSQELICVTTLFGAVVPTARPSMAPTVLAFDCPVNLSTPLTSQLLVTLNENATQTTLEELGQNLINTYNSFISETYSPCQTSKYREITNFTILTKDSVLVDGSSRVRGRRLTGIPIEADDIVFQLDGGCVGCNATQIFFDPDVLSRDDFVEYYSQVVDTGLDFLNEIVTMDCPSTNTSTFEITVIVEYVPDGLDSDALSLDVVLQQALADLYVTTYNDLSREYCDPYSRQLQSATIILVGDNNTQGNIPVEMEIVGTCSDCDGLALSVYDEPETQLASIGNTSNAVVINATGSLRRDLQSISRSGRSLQGSVSESCYCPAHPIGDRAPYETEFLDAYREAVNATSQPTFGQVARQLQVGNLDLGLFLSVAKCQFGTRFETGIVVRFQARVEDLTDEMIQSIEEALLQSIAALYPSSEVVCDPQFRIVKNVQASVVRDASRRRDLQSHRERKVQQVVSEAPSISPAPSASSAPSASFRPTFSLAGSPTQAPTIPTLDSGVVDFFLYVSGVCNGCENGITLSDQTIDGRRLQRVNEWWERQLQSEATSSCFCPIGSVIFEAPTLDELLSLFSTNLISLNITFQILDFGEVPVVDCTVPVTQFTTQFQYTMSLEPDVTSVQLQAVGDVVKSTYNSLGQDYCDPLDQTIDGVQLVEFSPASNAVVGQNPCADYDVTFQVIGSCRGCDGDSLLTSTRTSTSASGVRRLEMNRDPYGNFSNVLFATQDASSTTTKRRLQIATDSATECFCDGNVVANRAPNTEEYNNALATALNQFEVTNICGLPDLFPSSLPTLVPTLSPTLAPTLVPTLSPTLVPTLAPTLQVPPTLTPTVLPVVPPTLSPSFSPVVIPTPVPTLPPTLSPVTPVQVPAVIPTERPSAKPSAKPSERPSSVPSSRPSSKPSAQPSKIPSARPSTSAPAQPVSAQPSSKPSARPSSKPSSKPSSRPSSKPSSIPSARPSSSAKPSSKPSARPSTSPSAIPSSKHPSVIPSARPSTKPSAKPSARPSSKPSVVPSRTPSVRPSSKPSSNLSAWPSTNPSVTPSVRPSSIPSARPSSKPSSKPSTVPSSKPSARPSSKPSSKPSSVTSSKPSARPSVNPSAKPSRIPSARPTAIPSAKPSRSARPSSIPSARPSTNPSAKPSQSVRPSTIPSARPSSNPSAKPSQSARPSSIPSATVPSSSPSALPSTRPSSRPSQSPRPSSTPSAVPSTRPSDKPSARPSTVPSAKPSAGPSSGPSQSPTQFPSYIPSGIPFNCETDCPLVGPTWVCMYPNCVELKPLRFTLTWQPDDEIHLWVSLPFESATYDWLTRPDPMTGTYSYTATGTFEEYIELFAPSPVGSYDVCVDFSKVNGIGTDAYTLTISEGGVQKYDYNNPARAPPLPSYCFTYDYPRP